MEYYVGNTDFEWLIFSGPNHRKTLTSGNQVYEDGWDNPNVFTNTCEGQSGDMKFIRGNLGGVLECLSLEA